MYHTIETNLELPAKLFYAYKNKLAELSKENHASFYKDKNNCATNEIYHCELLRNKGVHITMACFVYNGFTRFFLMLRINPKRILNNNDFVSVTHESETEILYQKINKCLSSIGIYDGFEYFTINRIDYCINHRSFDENIANCRMKLMKRSVLLSGLNQILKYDDTQHRMIEYENAIYVRNQSVIINFYNKFPEMQERPTEYQGNSNDYRGVIRFEIQCLKPKVRSMKYSNELPDMRAFHWMNEEFSEKTLLFYINKIFCKGDYWVLSEAQHRVMNGNFRDSTKQIMLKLLGLTNEKRSLQKALDILHSEGIHDDFLNRILNKFDSINVNPVTIPINWGISYFESPLKIVLQAIENNKQIAFIES